MQPLHIAKWISTAFLLSLPSITSFAFSQSVDTTPAPKPSFDLNIDMPSIIRPKSEVLLETRYVNTTDHDLWFDGACPLWKTYDIILRDATGAPVLKTPAGQNAKCNYTTLSNVSIPLHPGEAITNELMLDKLYVLSKSGEYTVEVAAYDNASKSTVKSLLLHFRVPGFVSRSANASPAFSISISSPDDPVRSGWELPITMTLTNLSRRNLRLAIWEGVTAHAATSQPDEFGSGIEVFDDSQKIAMLPKEGGNDFYPNGKFLVVTIKPGATIQQVRALGGIYDIRKPGSYRVRAVLIDPTTNVAVESNHLNVTVADPSSLASAAMHANRPPFMVSIRSFSEIGSNEKFPLLICMTNISDHEIRLDNAITKDIVYVHNSAGKPTELTDAGRTLQKQFGSTGLTTATVKSGEALCGVIGVGILYDFSASGDYTVRVDRYDEPDASPGQALQSLPIVRSNTATLSVPNLDNRN